MKLNVSVCRKEGRAKFGSEGASCSMEFELDAESAKSLESIRGAIAKIYKICDDAVTEQLVRAAADPTMEPGEGREEPEPREEPRRRPRDTEYESRRDDHPPAEYEERYEPRNGSPPRRDDRERYRSDGGGRRQTNSDREPQTGKQLYGWANDRDQVKWFIEFGKAERFPARMNDWNERDVEDAMRAYHDRERRAASNGNGRH